MPYGPCNICGVTNYPNSLGGPYMCPTCDCGIFRPSVSTTLSIPFSISPSVSISVREVYYENDDERRKNENY
jgi:hypothetical protein